MEACFQSERQSVAEHGRSVAQHYLDLLQHIDDRKPALYEWKLPSWVHSPFILNHQLPFQTVMTYLIMHDCGKPYCRTVDEEGRQHFPDHASVSKEVFNHVRTTSGYVYSRDDELVARLIGEDMDAHLLKAEGVDEFALRETAPTLLLSALAELHSNAKMFGGMESIGFKSKWRNLNRRGKALVNIWKDKNNG